MQQESAQSARSDAFYALLADTPTGELLTEYRVKIDRSLITGGLIATFFFCFFTSFGIFLYKQNTNSHNALPVGIGALLLFAVALFFYGRWLFSPWWYRLETLVVCSRGLARLRYNVFQSKYKMKDMVLWDEIASVASKHTDAPESHSLSGHGPIYTIVTTSGKRWKLHGPFEHLRELGSTIETRVVQRLLPMLLEELQGGQKLTFGHLQIDQQGINDQKQRVLWSDVARLEVTAQTLDFELGQKWGRPVSLFHENTPNGAALITLVKYSIEKVRAGASTSRAYL